MLDFLEENKDISSISNFKTPARAKYYFEVSSMSDVYKIPSIYKYSKETGLDILFIGGGTNIFFNFKLYNGIIIKNNLLGWSYDKEKKILKSFSQENISQIAQELEYNYGQDIWHRFIGLPGTVGGAIFGNAGCFGLETESNFLQARILDIDTGEILTLGKEEMGFSYRNSKMKEEKKYFIIEGVFDLSEKKEKYHSDVDNIYFRETKQPKGNTCGSFFKNPKINQEGFLNQFPEYKQQFIGADKKVSAGFLLESIGLKGYRIGGAYFSKKHANFLMHDGTGTHKDISDLIVYAQKQVENKYSILLEPEVIIISSN